MGSGGVFWAFWSAWGHRRIDQRDPASLDQVLVVLFQKVVCGCPGWSGFQVVNVNDRLVSLSTNSGATAGFGMTRAGLGLHRSPRRVQRFRKIVEEQEQEKETLEAEVGATDRTPRAPMNEGFGAGIINPTLAPVSARRICTFHSAVIAASLATLAWRSVASTGRASWRRHGVPARRRSAIRRRRN